MIQKDDDFNKNKFNEKVPMNQLLHIDLKFLKDDSAFNIQKNKEVIDVLFSYCRTAPDYGDILYKTINLFLEELHELSEEPFDCYKLYHLVKLTIASYINYLLSHDQKRLESFLEPEILDKNTNFSSYLEIRHFLFVIKAIEKDFSKKYSDLTKLFEESYKKVTNAGFDRPMLMNWALKIGSRYEDFFLVTSSSLIETKKIKNFIKISSQDNKNIIYLNLDPIIISRSLCEEMLSTISEDLSCYIATTLTGTLLRNLINKKASALFEGGLLCLLDDKKSQEQKDSIHKKLIQLAKNYSILGIEINIDKKYFTRDIASNIKLEEYLNHILLNDSHTYYLKYLINEFQNSTEEKHSKLLNEKIVNFLNIHPANNNKRVWVIADLDLRNLDLSNLEGFNSICFREAIFNKDTIFDPRTPGLDIENSKFHVNGEMVEKITHEAKENKTMGALEEYLKKNSGNIYIHPDDLYDLYDNENAKNFPFLHEEQYGNNQRFYRDDVLSKSAGGQSFFTAVCIKDKRAAETLTEYKGNDDKDYDDISYVFKVYLAKEFTDEIFEQTLKERKILQIENAQLRQQIEALTAQNEQLAASLEKTESKTIKRKALEGKEEINPSESNPESLNTHTKRLKSLKESSDASKGIGKRF